MPDISLSAGVDTSGVAAGMASIENQVAKSARSIGQTLQGYLTAGALIAEFQKIANAAEDIHRESQRFGIDAEQLQLVSNAAKTLGLDLGTVARGMNLLEINAQKALDPSTEQALAMEHLGISAQKFSQLNMEQKFLALADAYAHSKQDGQAYADVAELIGRRNTELIPLLAQGSQAIIDRGKAIRIMSNEEIDTLHALKVEETKYLASLDGFFAQSIVGWGRLFTSIKHEFENFESWTAQHPTFWRILSGNWFGAGGGAAGGGSAPSPGMGPSARSLMITPPGAGAAEGRPPPPPAEMSPTPSGRGGGIGLTADVAGLNLAGKLNELTQERAELVKKINSEEEQGDQHAASRFQLQKQIDAIDTDILAVTQRLSIEETKGIQAADEKIQKSKDRVALDQLEADLQTAEFNRNDLLARDLRNQIELTKTELDYNEKIQKAIDDANNARAKGLELTAEENDKLAQQLELEKQQVLAEQQQQQERQRILSLYGPNPLTISAMAQGNLRLGAGSDVYARALAASRGLKPGTPAYDQLVQQITAQDRLRQLQGQNLSWMDQLQRDKLVQWFAAQEEQRAGGAAATSHNQEIAYWQAIASGQPPPMGNPYSAFYSPQATSGATGAAAQQILQLGKQLDLSQQQLIALQQIVKNTETVHVG